jgi:hypothetical protein
MVTERKGRDPREHDFELQQHQHCQLEESNIRLQPTKGLGVAHNVHVEVETGAVDGQDGVDVTTATEQRTLHTIDVIIAR